MNEAESKLTVHVKTLTEGDTPSCAHGPMVMFERLSKNQKWSSKFYACTAFRDKHCQKIFLTRNVQKHQAASASQHLKRLCKSSALNRYFNRLKLMRQLKTLTFCTVCSKFVLPEEKSSHSKHKLQTNLPRRMLQQPTRLLPPLELDKSNAQYFFSDQTVKFILETIKQLDYRKVLCIGTPRLHEAFLTEKRSKWHSLLLDMDYRLMQFFSPMKILLYNMFNNHLFGGALAGKILDSFLREDTGRVLVILDPPFGGRVELLAHTLAQLSERWHEANKSQSSSLLPTFWISPYFMDKKILTVPGFDMLAYKVEYDNHDVFRNTSGKTKATRGSIVRIFTNLPHIDVKLPVDEGYRFCAECNRYVGAEAEHCWKCQQCSNRDGRSYRHCDDCGRCVKSSRQHCIICSWCLPPHHNCRQTLQRIGGHLAEEHTKTAQLGKRKVQQMFSTSTEIKSSNFSKRKKKKKDKT